MTLRLFRNFLLVAFVVPALFVPAIIVTASRLVLDTLHDTLNGDRMEKPLPDLPPSTDSGRARRLHLNLTLTIEARAHLHRFIARTLEEEADVKDRETWVERIESSLDELGASLSRGGWLLGLRRARYVRKRQHDEEAKRRAEEQAWRDKEAEEQARNRTAKGRSKLKESVVVDIADDPDDEQRQAALDQLRELVSKPSPPTPKPSAKHLLLTVAGPPTSEPAEDMGFKLVRSAIHCSYKAGEFSMPSTLSQDRHLEPVILFGLEEWDGE